MTKDEAVKLVRGFCACYPNVKLDEENRDAYVDAIAKLRDPRQTYRAMDEVAQKEQRFPTLAKLLYLIRQAEVSLRSPGENAPTYTGRATLKVSDSCIHCGRKITDQEFEDGNWTFVEDGQEHIVGREHRRCHPKAETEAAGETGPASVPTWKPEPIPF